MKTLNIFIGGGVKLLHGQNEDLKGYRKDVIDPIISELNSQDYKKFFYLVKDFTDLTRNVVKGKQQEVYNKFIRKEAKIALFIIDGDIGSITKEEIEVAVESTKRFNHPVVYVYGKNVRDGSSLSEYLNKEGIYYQHFINNSDLTSKIRKDIIHSSEKLTKRNKLIFSLSFIISLMIIGALWGIFQFYNRKNSGGKVIDNCTAQLYLMRYIDINIISGKSLFTDSLLAQFKYEDTICNDNFKGGNDTLKVFPVFQKEKSIPTTPPFFRIKLHNKDRNTVVFIEAFLEIDQLSPLFLETSSLNFKSENLDFSDFNKITINPSISEYPLPNFRWSVGYGETDDNYMFYLETPHNYKFRMRIKAVTHNKEYIYSNYVYVECFKWL